MLLLVLECLLLLFRCMLSWVKVLMLMFSVFWVKFEEKLVMKFCIYFLV